MPEQIPLMVDAVTQELRQFASDETIPQGQLLAALQVALTGLVTNNVSGVLASDTILQALGKLQAQASSKVDKVAGKQLSTEDYTSDEKEKLSGIAAGATANSTDANLRDRANHTGTQAISTVSGLQAALDSKETPAGALAQIKSFGLGQERFGDVTYGAPKILPIQIGNSAPTRFITAESGDPQVDAHAPESGQAFSGLSISRGLRPVQIGVSGAGAGAKLWFRGYSGPASVLADWKQAPSIDYNATTASAANVFMLATGGLQRSTSSAKYKTQVEPADAVLMQRIIDDAEPVWYRSLCEADPAGYSYWGLLAESLAEIDPRFVHWARPNKTVERTEQVEVGRDENDQPIYETHTYTEEVSDTDAPLQAEGVQYERLVVPLLWHAKKTQAHVEALEQRLAALEAANG